MHAHLRRLRLSSLCVSAASSPPPRHDQGGSALPTVNTPTRTPLPPHIELPPPVAPHIPVPEDPHFHRKERRAAHSRPALVRHSNFTLNAAEAQ